MSIPYLYLVKSDCKQVLKRSNTYNRYSSIIQFKPFLVNYYPVDML